MSVSLISKGSLIHITVFFDMCGPVRSLSLIPLSCIGDWIDDVAFEAPRQLIRKALFHTLTNKIYKRELIVLPPTEMQTVCIGSRNPFLLHSGGIAVAFAAVDRPAAGKWPVE